MKTEQLRELALFAGAGGGILGGHLLGWRIVCAVEFAAYPRSVLLARQRDGMLPKFPVWDDVRTFDGTAWRGSVDVISGGFPCQDISAAGSGLGLSGERSGLWSEMARIIGEVRPRFAFVENSPVLTSRGLDVVLGDLAAMGYDAEWGVLGAWNACAPHERERIWILANAREDGRLRCVFNEVYGTKGGRPNPTEWGEDWHMPEMVSSGTTLCRAWDNQPDPPPVADGMANWLDELAASGNGQVPIVAALAWNTLYSRIQQRR